MYLLKKIVTEFFMPLPFSLGLCFIGLGFLWFTARQKTGRLLVTAGVVLLALFSYGFVGDLLMNPLEKPYAPLVLNTQPDGGTRPSTQAKWIVVLGSGNLADARAPGRTFLTASSMFRVVEGVRLYRQLPGAKLILAGGPTNNPVSEAETMSQTAVDLGVPKQDIVLEPVAKDTEGQAQTIQALVKDDQFILVSSGFHLPRALFLFRKRGLAPIPAAVDYRAANGGPFSDDFFPQAPNIRKLELAIHEYLGMMWYRVRGER